MHRAAARSVLAHELLAQLRRQPAEQRQAHVAAQDRAELRPGAALVRAHHDHAGDLHAFGQRAHAVDGRRRGGAAVARVDDEHDRRIEAGGDVHGARTAHALPAVQRRLHCREQDQVAALAPVVEEFQHGVLVVQGKVEDARRPRAARVEQPPEGDVQTDADGADGPLSAETGQHGAGGEGHGRAGLEPAEDEPGHRHVGGSSFRRAARWARARSARETDFESRDRIPYCMVEDRGGDGPAQTTS